jgi:hypothetical protein
MKPKAERAICSVMTQYRSGSARVLELESRGVSLDVHVKPEGTEDWVVTAQSGRGADAIVITESAATRGEALIRVARAWTAKAPDLGLPDLDWDAVTAALAAVRAI